MAQRCISRDATVVINSFNQGPTLDLALEGLSRQDFTGTWEIVVVDDGSHDGTDHIVASWERRLAVPLTYVRLPKQGMRWSRARNIGMDQAEGNVLLFFDADMVPDSQVVRLHVVEQARSPCLLGGDRLWRNALVDLPDHGSTRDCLECLRTSVSSADADCIRRESAERHARLALMDTAFPWRAAFGCHISFPAPMNLRYDESMLGWGPSDVELNCRLYHDKGLPVRFLPEARAWHVEREGAHHNPFRSTDSVAVNEYVRQVCYMIHKHLPLDLRAVIDMGFDRIVLGPDDQWHTVQRGRGGDKARTMEIALAWYGRTDRPGHPND